MTAMSATPERESMWYEAEEPRLSAELSDDQPPRNELGRIFAGSHRLLVRAVELSAV